MGLGLTTRCSGQGRPFSFCEAIVSKPIMPSIETGKVKNQEVTGHEHIRTAVNLINWSGLAIWQPDQNCFQPADEHEFVRRHESRGEFGRLISWLVFSVGAEYLAKGICLANGAVTPKKISVLEYPEREGTIEAWVTNVLNGTAAKVDQIAYGTLGDYYGKKVASSYFGKLRGKGKLSDEKFRLVVAGYRVLGEAIRNRDAHTYVRDVRGGHFYLVEKLFVPCFNALLEALPNAQISSGRLSST